MFSVIDVKDPIDGRRAIWRLYGGPAPVRSCFVPLCVSGGRLVSFGRVGRVAYILPRMSVRLDTHKMDLAPLTMSVYARLNARRLPCNSRTLAVAEGPLGFMLTVKLIDCELN
jgi:hypothetical protein